MTDLLGRVLKLSDRLIRVGLLMASLFVGSVVLKFAIEYTVNSLRGTAHWVEYFDVQPTREIFSIGEPPKFISHSIWHHRVLAKWPDVMWCLMEGGEEEGRTIRFSLKPMDAGPRKPGMSGFYDEDGDVIEGSSDGVWTWEGLLPRHPATCTLEPKPMIFPSPLVSRQIDLENTRLFRFR